MQEDLDELFFLPRTDIVKRVGGARRFELRVVLVVINQARIVEDDAGHLVCVSPEIFVVTLDGFRHITQTVGGDGENCGWGFHSKITSDVKDASRNVRRWDPSRGLGGN